MEIRRVINIFITILVVLSMTSVIRFTNFLFIIPVIFALILNLFTEKTLNRHLLTLIAISIAILIAVNTSINTLVSSLIKIILIFIAIKLLEEKRYRDYMQIITLSVFLITASGLMDISMIFLLYILIAIFLINFLIILLTIYDNSSSDITIRKDELKQIFIKTSIIPTLAIPFAMFLFLVIPRTNTPLFDFLGRADTAKTGFTSQINLGQVSSIQETESIAFRAKMPEIDPQKLYWRSVVFDIYKDGSWHASNNRGRVRFRFDNLNYKEVSYEIYLEPTSDKYLILLDKPTIVNYKEPLIKTENLEFLTQKEISKKIFYTGKSILSETFIDTDSDIDNAMDKDGIPNSILNLAKELKKGSEIETIQNIEAFLKKNYSYSLQDLPKGVSPVEEFLFNNKKGNCEYFASAMALLLRGNDIPARLVGGFLGGYYNKNAGYYAVSNKNAHVWVEALVDNKWMRIDPTPAPISYFTQRQTLSFMMKMRIYLDYISFYWTKFVINYNLQTQIEIAMKLTHNFKNFNLRPPASIFLIIPSLTIFIIIYLSLKLKKGGSQYILNKFYNELSRKGIKIDHHLSIYQNIENIKDPLIKAEAIKFAKEFNRMLFKDGKLEKNTLHLIIKNIKKLK